MTVTIGSVFTCEHTGCSSDMLRMAGFARSQFVRGNIETCQAAGKIHTGERVTGYLSDLSDGGARDVGRSYAASTHGTIILISAVTRWLARLRRLRHPCRLNGPPVRPGVVQKNFTVT